MTCRGSRRNTLDKAKNIFEDSPEWLEQNMRSTRNFIRKWGHFVKHDKFMKPVIPPKYDIGFIIHNSNLNLLKELEPWCSTVFVDNNKLQYISLEQPFTLYNLKNKVLGLDQITASTMCGVMIEINGDSFSNEDFRYIQSLSEILANDDTLDIGSFRLGNLNITINNLQTYEKELILCKKQ